MTFGVEKRSPTSPPRGPRPQVIDITTIGLAACHSNRPSSAPQLPGQTERTERRRGPTGVQNADMSRAGRPLRHFAISKSSRPDVDFLAVQIRTCHECCARHSRIAAIVARGHALWLVDGRDANTAGVSGYGSAEAPGEGTGHRGLQLILPSDAPGGLADRHQLVDRVPGKVAVDDGRHHQFVQRDRALVVVKERDVGSIASGGDAHQRLPRRQQGPVDHSPLPLDERLGDRMEVHRVQARRIHRHQRGPAR